MATNTYPGKRPLADKYYVVNHADVTVATASAYCPIAAQGQVKKVQSCLQGAITGADETLNIYKNGTDTGYDITITQSGSAAGDVDSVDIPDGGITVIEGDYLSVVSANASGGSVGATINYIVREL